MLLESLRRRDGSLSFCFPLRFNVRNMRDLTGADRRHFTGDTEERDRWGGQIKGEAVAAAVGWQGEESGQGLA